MGLTVDIDTTQIVKLAEKAMKKHREMIPILRQDMKVVAEKVLYEAVKRTPVGKAGKQNRELGHRGSGTTRRQWLIKPAGDLAYDIRNDGKVALFLDQGTKPYVIRPVKKKALAFVAGGKPVVVKSVNHPGIKARNMTGQAKEVGNRLIKEVFMRRAKELGDLK